MRKNYIRTCLSLDEETRQTITEIAEITGTTKSEVVKQAIKHFWKAIKRCLK